MIQDIPPAYGVLLWGKVWSEPSGEFWPLISPAGLDKSVLSVGGTPDRIMQLNMGIMKMLAKKAFGIHDNQSKTCKSSIHDFTVALILDTQCEDFTLHIPTCHATMPINTTT